MMITRITGVLLLVIMIASCGCTTPSRGLFPPGQNDPVKSVYLVSHGWHAGIVLRQSDLAKEIWPLQHDFPHAEFLEVGWGDRDFYRTLKPGFKDKLQAVLWPTSSVLHIVGFSGPVTTRFPYSEIIEIELTSRGFKQLSEFIAASFALDDTGHVQASGKGLYGDSQFYLSNQTYHLFNTCNVWTAKALQAAGCPIGTAFTVTVDNLMSQARSFGRLVQSRPARLE
jgi:uncharacterized protein (TIGR02117 family)